MYLVPFFCVVYGFSWLLWAPAALDWLPPPFVVVGAFGPTFAGLLFTFRAHGSTGLFDLLRSARPQLIHLKVYSVSLMLPPVIIGAALLVVSILSGPPAWEPPFPWFLIPGHLLVGLVLLGPLHEEFGWRGYLLPRLLPRGVFTASLLVGISWGLWHLPLFFVEGSFYSHLPVWLFLLSVVVVSFLYTGILVENEGSLFGVLLLHASSNTATLFFLSDSVTRGDLGPYSMSVGVTCIVVAASWPRARRKAVIVQRMRPAYLRDRPR